MSGESLSHGGQTEAMARVEPPGLTELRPGIYWLRGDKPGSHVYLIKGRNKNALIDTGITKKFPQLKSRLSELGLRVRDIGLVILTHEHFDHIGATTFFHPTAVVAAHSLAANKLELQDEFVTLNKYRNQPSKPFWVDLWLEDGSTIDLGNYELRVIHTPGHTSGCICLHETREGLLFTGDTVFAGGTLSQITGSGNVSDYMNSVKRLSLLKVREIYPGHGRFSDTADADFPKAIAYAKAMLDDSKLFFEAFIGTRELQEGSSGYWKDSHRGR